MFWWGFNRFLQCCSRSILPSSFSLFLSSFNPPRVPPYFSPHRHPIASICYDTHEDAHTALKAFMRTQKLSRCTFSMISLYFWHLTHHLFTSSPLLQFSFPSPVFHPLHLQSSPSSVSPVPWWTIEMPQRMTGCDWKSCLAECVSSSSSSVFSVFSPLSLASAPAWWPTLASLWSPIMHCDGCVSAQPDLGETISKQQAEINSAASPGNSFPLLVFLLSLSVWLSYSLTTPQRLFFSFSRPPRYLAFTFFATPSRLALCLHLLSCHLSFCDLFIAFFFPASYPLLPHTHRPEHLDAH